jgi:hypothetical protein
MISDQDLSSLRAELAKSLVELIRNHGTKEFDEAKNWFTRAHIERADEAFIVRIAEALANTLLDGLVQLSVEQVTKTVQYQDALQRGAREVKLGINKTLPTLLVYVEFIFTYGSVEVATIRYEFTAESEVDAKDIRVIIVKNRISQVFFGNVALALTLKFQAGGAKVEIGSIRKELNLEYEFKLPTLTEALTRLQPPPSRDQQVLEAAA